MGLFGKGKKASWELTEEGGYRFFLGDENVTDDIEAGWYEEDHLVVFCETDETYYFLKNFTGQNPEERQPAEFITNGGDLLYIKDEEEAYNLYSRGRAVATEFPHALTNKDLWFYDPEEGRSYVLEGKASIKPYTFVTPRLVSEEPDVGIYYKVTDSRYQFIYRGEDVSSEIKLVQSNEDLIIYHPKAQRQFFFQDEKKMKKNSWHMDTFSNPDSIPLFKSVGKNNYKLYYKGKNIAGVCNAIPFGNNVVICYPDEDENFWVDAALSLKPGTYQDGSSFARGKKLLWYTNGREYHLYYEGREITKEAQLQRYENSAVVMHEDSMSMFQLEDFFTTSDSVIRGA
jgi:hypothetical protein